MFHIIVGAGHHSKGNPVLKGAVNSWLSNKDYDFYPDLAHGQFLVRISK